MSDQGEPRGGGFDWEGAEDITAVSEEEPSERLGRLVEEERSLSYRRRVLQGKDRRDPGRARTAGAVVRSPKELVRALMGYWRP